MKIDRAIKLLTQMSEYGVVAWDKQDLDSIKLGVEALKRIRDMRLSPCTTADEILPGETEK